MDLLPTLEKFYLLHPKVFDRKRDSKYWTMWIAIIVVTAFVSFRMMMGAFSPKIGLILGNSFNVLGLAGQVMSLGAGICCPLIPYFRIQLLRQKDKLPFLRDLLNYGDRRRKAILSDDDGKKIVQVADKMLRFLKPASKFVVIEFFLAIFVVCVIIPTMLLGVTLHNILFWSFWVLPQLVVGYYLAIDSMYVYGIIWFLPKYHLDMQSDVIIGKMEQFKMEQELREIHAIYLDHMYNRLVIRVKQFDILSRDLISSSRLVMSYAIGIIIFATTQHSNLALQYILCGCCVTIYVVFVSFLSTACSLSLRRKKMYHLANQLFVKASSQRKTTVRTLFTLRRLVKSLGNRSRPTICLTDESGVEFEPMEFFEFIFNTLINFTLIAKIYRDHLH